MPGSSFRGTFLRRHYRCRCLRGGGPARRHHARHPCEPRHSQAARASVTTLCKLQLATGAESFQQRYLSSWQTNKFYVLGFFFSFFFFLREEIPLSLTKNKHFCYATSWRPDWEGAVLTPPALALLPRPHLMTLWTLTASSGIQPGIGTTPRSHSGRGCTEGLRVIEIEGWWGTAQTSHFN